MAYLIQYSEMVPEPIRPKKPKMLMSDTKTDTLGCPRATPICPMLFNTAIPGPTPQRKDANRHQKSNDRITCKML